MPNRRLVIDVLVDASGRGTRKLGEISQGVAGAGRAAAGASAAFTRMAGALAGGVALGRIKAFAEESITLFGRQEDAIASLEQALRNQGAPVAALSGQYQELASKLQGLTTAGDEAIIEMQALLTSVGGVAPAQMEDALTAVLDLSEGMGKGLRESALAVAKAFKGKTEVLAELGIELDKTAGAADLGTQAIDALNERFGGRAAAAAETYTGQIEQLSNQWGDLKEEIAPVLVQLAQELIPLIRQGITWFQGLSPEIKEAAVVVAGLSAAILAVTPIIAAVGVSIAAIATGPIAAIVAALIGLTAVWVAWGDDIVRIVSETFTAVRDWMVGRFGAIVDGVREKVDAVKGFFSDMFNDIVGNSIVPDLINGIGAEFNRLESVMVAPAQTALDSLTGSFQGWADNMGGLMGNLFGGGGILSGIMTGGMSTIMSSLSGLATKGLKAIGGAFKKLFGGPSADELAGREIVENFQANMQTILTDQQQVEAGTEPWKAANIAVRDSYLEVGLSEQQAMADVQALYDAIKSGPEATQGALDVIMGRMESLRESAQGAASAFGALIGQAKAAGDQAGAIALARQARAAASVPSFQTGGVMPHTGLAMLHKGETIIPAGRGGGGITVNVQGGFFSSPADVQMLANRLNAVTLRQVQRQRQL